jgi:hypothetical protein
MSIDEQIAHHTATLADASRSAEERIAALDALASMPPEVRDRMDPRVVMFLPLDIRATKPRLVGACEMIAPDGTRIAGG